MEEQKQETQKEKEAAKHHEKADVPKCCAGCVRWGRFGRQCWYYWEAKKHCTMWVGSWEEVMP